MATPTDYYVDPSIAADSGAGTSGDPYGDIQYALDQVGSGTAGRDTVNGDRFNIKAGTDEILAAGLDLTTYGSATKDAPLVFQGYTTTAGDGGVGGIDGDGTYGMFDVPSNDFMAIIDMHVHNTGSVICISVDNTNRIIRCEVDNSTGGGIHCDNNSIIINCYVHNVSGTGIQMRDGFISRCMVEDGTNTLTTGIKNDTPTNQCYFENNIIKLSTVGATGIEALSNANGDIRKIVGNSIYNSAAGTGRGVDIDTTIGETWIMANNLIEGFSGAGGEAIGGTGHIKIQTGNGAFNCTTDFAFTAYYLDEDNENLAATPFASKTTFDPADTDNILATDGTDGAWPTTLSDGTIIPYVDKGAVQNIPASGGGGIRLAGSGGLVG